MKSVRVLMAALCLSGLAATASVATADEELPAVTVDGLHLLHDTQLAIVYADPEAELTGYKRIRLLDAAVAFKKNWARDHNRSSAMRITSSDMERIKTRLATEFHEVFRNELAAGGYELTDENAEDVLLLRPAIINLDPTAPDTMTAGRSQTHVRSAGEMTLYIELYDALTGDLLAKALDRQVDPDRHFYTWANSATNKAAADRILKGWARILREALDQANKVPDAGDTTTRNEP